MNEDLLLIQLRDCFTAGYTFPQFCIDNGIKKPLFVAIDGRRADLMWEIYVQFSFDKRISPKFTLINGQHQTLGFSPGTIFGSMELESPNELDFKNFDGIFVLSVGRFPAEYKRFRFFYLDELTSYFIRHTYVEIPFYHFLQRNPKIKFFLTNFPTLRRDKATSEYEAELLKQAPFLLSPMRKNLIEHPDAEIKTPYDSLGYNRQEIIDMLGTGEIITQPDGSTIFKDDDCALVGIKNGKRRVPNQPENFKNRIYFVGGCSHYGVGAPFDKTIPSYLQKFLNENNLPYRVENESQFFTYRYQDILYNLNQLPLQPNDIVIVFFDNIIVPTLPCIDVSNTFLRPHNYGEIFVDSAHVNEIGYRILAEKFFQLLVQNNFFKDNEFHYPPPASASASLWHSA